ncbi:MAG: Bax inhibitor-1 family protein [Thermoleophilia bacterium]|nr:Bax inhibitor-1 family protein [Thermoleophilia bacterium]
MGLVAVTVAFAAAGVWIGRDLSGWQWFVPWLFALGCLIGLNVANARRKQGLALTLLFAFGLLLGISIGSTVHYYAATDSKAVAQAAAATALFTAALGAGGYATRRDLSALYRILFWLLLALIVFGIVLIFINIPGGATIYALLGLAIFAGYVLVDFNRLRRAGSDEVIPLAAGIFLDIFNIFLLFLQLFGRR